MTTNRIEHIKKRVMIFYNDLYVAALGGLPTEFACLFLLRYKNLCIIYIHGKYKSILTEKMIMQAIYSKSICRNQNLE